MDKGIRAYARTYFAAQNALRVDPAAEKFKGTKGNTAFRKEVMTKLMEEFGVTLASAATHYNEALIETRKKTPEAVEGLGRPADKKGGRKKKEDAAPAVDAELNTSDVGDSAALPNILQLEGPDASAANDAPAAEALAA